jgi:bacteriocin-like protein
MQKQKNWEEILEWASSNDENRKEAIIIASKFIALLTMTSGKNLSKDELKKIIGGAEFCAFGVQQFNLAKR